MPAPPSLPPEVVSARATLQKTRTLLGDDPEVVGLARFTAFVFWEARGAIPVIVPKKGYEQVPFDAQDVQELARRLGIPLKDEYFNTS